MITVCLKIADSICKPPSLAEFRYILAEMHYRAVLKDHGGCVLLVTCCTSARTTSASRSTRRARSVMSSRLPMGVATMYSPAARLAGAFRVVRTGCPSHLISLLPLPFPVLSAATVLLPWSADFRPVLAAAEYGELCIAMSPWLPLCREPCRVTVKGLAEHALIESSAL